MEFELLDHGYLKLVERWGSDQSIIEAARMSTNKGFLGWGPIECSNCCNGVVPTDETCEDTKPCSKCKGTGRLAGDEKLLRYLYENKHSTPFEMAGLTIEVQAPIFVFREWHRHRVPFGYNEMCLAADTEITCIGSGGLTRHYTIEHIFKMKHVGVEDSVGRTRKLPSCASRTLRVLDEATETYVTAPMKDVWQSGVQEVWRVQTAKGHSIKASARHPFYTREGWKKLADLRPGDRLAANGLVAAMERPYPPALRAGIGVWTSMMRSRLIDDEDTCYVCGGTFSFSELELDHVVPVVEDLRRALDDANLKPICERCHLTKSASEQPHKEGQTRLGLRWVDIAGRPVRVGEELTYDIEVKGPHKNFVANGLVVHNSARYTPLPDLNYVPTVERLMMGGGHLTKQAGTIKGAEQLTTEVVDFYRAKLRQEYENDQRFYEEALKMGVPKELARVHLPVGRYSRMRATGNLRGWLAFMTLRAAKNAQYEIRVYADALGKILEKEFPRTWELFAEGRP